MLSGLDALLAGLVDRPRWLVAYSGGLDSTVLLHALHAWLARCGGDNCPQLLAIHVNHGLSPHAADWSRHCASQAAALGVACRCVSVSVAAGQPDGLEAAARAARYGVFERLRRDGDVLFLGHHRDDQVETVMLRLFRSAGVQGLAGMACQSGPQSAPRLRPLLGVGRQQLLRYAREQELSWIEDESNEDLRFSRNFVRHRLLPLVAEHWPDGSRQLLSLSRAAGEAASLLDEVALEDLSLAAARDRWGAYLRLGPLRDKSPARTKNALRHWLHSLGQPALRQRQWPVFLGQFLSAGEDAMPRLDLANGSLRRYRAAVYWVPAALAQQPLALAAWDLGYPLELGSGGHLSARQSMSGGLCPGRYELRYRQGGESLQRGTTSVSLKNLLQEAAVPPWWRDRLPLLFCDGKLAAAADLAVSSAFRCAPGAAAYALDWSPPI